MSKPSLIVEYDSYLAILEDAEPGVVVGEGPREINMQIEICRSRLDYLAEKYNYRVDPA